MEKYAVQLDDKVKTADSISTKTTEPKCPKCNKELIENNQYMMFCVSCGTLPFEKTK